MVSTLSESSASVKSLVDEILGRSSDGWTMAAAGKGLKYALNDHCVGLTHGHRCEDDRNGFCYKARFFPPTAGVVDEGVNIEL